MAFVHGKNTFVSLAGIDLSPYSNNTEFNREADSHDVTTYGKHSHVFTGGLLTGTATLSGIYDSSTQGPRRVIEPLIGTVVPLVHRPEGTGTGRPQDTVQVLVTAYNETSPVADMVAWTAELQLSDDVTTTDQT